MRISDIRTLPVFDAARGINYMLTKVETDEGIHGWGEAGIAGKELAIQGVIEHFKPILVGMDPMRTDFIWQRLFRGGFFKGGPLLSAAISGVDIALWDIKGKALGVPVWQLLGRPLARQGDLLPARAGRIARRAQGRRRPGAGRGLQIRPLRRPGRHARRHLRAPPGRDRDDRNHSSHS